MSLQKLRHHLLAIRAATPDLELLTLDLVHSILPVRLLMIVQVRDRF